MITMEYAGGFGLAAFGAMTLDEIKSRLIAMNLHTLTAEGRISTVSAFLRVLSAEDRATTIQILESIPETGAGAILSRDELAEIKTRIVERGFLAKYWWLWTVLGVIGVTGFGLIVYRGRKSKRRRR